MHDSGQGLTPPAALADGAPPVGTEQALVVYVLRGQASSSALLSLSVGMKVILASFNVVIGLIAMAAMLHTLRWRSATGSDPDPAPQ